MSMDHTYLMTLIEMNRYAKAKTLFDTYEINEVSSASPPAMRLKLKTQNARHLPARSVEKKSDVRRQTFLNLTEIMPSDSQLPYARIKS